jgi:hypothetical protein
MPKKHDEVVFCPLSDKQYTVYEKFLKTPAVQNMIRSKEQCECGSGQRYVSIAIDRLGLDIELAIGAGNVMELSNAAMLYDISLSSSRYLIISA